MMKSGSWQAAFVTNIDEFWGNKHSSDLSYILEDIYQKNMAAKIQDLFTTFGNVFIRQIATWFSVDLVGDLFYRDIYRGTNNVTTYNLHRTSYF